MTVDEVDRVFRDIGSLDVVRLTGGEPFLREDLASLCEAILLASNPLILHITTNGSCPDRVVELAKAFKKPSRLHFMVSFDGLEAEHNRSRGDRVTYAQAINTVEALSDLRRTRGIQVVANHTVISNQSLDDHEGLVEAIGRFGVDVYAVLAYQDSAMYGQRRRGTRALDLVSSAAYPLHQAIDLDRAQAFVREEHARMGQKLGLQRVAKRFYLAGLGQRLEDLDSTPLAAFPKCTALRSHLRILPDGGVPVCQFNTEIVGNLRTQSFADVWASLAAREARAWVDACSGCWAECEVMPSALYSGAFLRPRAWSLAPAGRRSPR